MRKGVTLIELIIFIAIFCLVIVSFIAILVSILTVQTNQSAAASVNTEGQFLLQQIQYDVSSARLIDLPQDTATSTLTLREPLTSTYDPLILTLASGTVYAEEGVTSTPQALTSAKVSVSSISFTRHYNLSTSSAPYGTDSVSFSFTMTATSTNGDNYSQSFQSSVAVLAPVPKIALVQKTAGAVNHSLSYPTPNETSSLLIALLDVEWVNATSAPSISLSDTAGNSWNPIMTGIKPAEASSDGTDTTELFYAVNAKNSTNTVSANVVFPGGGGFGLGGANGVLYIYEYRGASTSSPLDATGTQFQSSTTAPTSGLVNPTSSVELLFGIDAATEFSSYLSVGSGYTLVSNENALWNYNCCFVENEEEDITGSVAGTWNLQTGTTNSTAYIATFK